MRKTWGALLAVAILAIAGVMALAKAPISPQVQKVEQVLPDDKIPH